MDMLMCENIITHGTILRCNYTGFNEHCRERLIKNISNAASTLRVVDTGYNDIITKIVVRHPDFKHMALKTLILHNIFLEIKDLLTILKYIKHNTTLERVIYTGEFKKNKEAKLIKYLSNISSLAFLELSSRAIVTLDAYYALSKLIRTHKTLNHLDLSSSKLSSDAIHVVLASAGHHMSLKTLILSGNNLHDKGRKNGAFALGEMLRHNSTLQKLDVSGCCLREGVKYILKALKYNDHLIKLNIRYNDLDDNIATNISDMLNHNNTLLSLKISDNNIGQSCWQMISASLEKNSTLKTFKMTSNYIDKNIMNNAIDTISKNNTITKLCVGSLGAYVNENHLAKMIQHRSLRKLFLNDVYIGPHKAAILCGALGQNCQLKLLSLWNTAIDVVPSGFYYSGIPKNICIHGPITYETHCRRGTTLLLEAMKTNKSLKDLTLWDPLFDHTSYTNIINILAINDHLKKITFYKQDYTTFGARRDLSIGRQNAELLLNVLKFNYRIVELKFLCINNDIRQQVNYFLNRNICNKKLKSTSLMSMFSTNIDY